MVRVHIIRDMYDVDIFTHTHTLACNHETTHPQIYAYIKNTNKKGGDELDRLANAKYAVSLARRLGACIFLAPEDIVEVKFWGVLKYEYVCVEWRQPPSLTHTRPSIHSHIHVHTTKTTGESPRHHALPRCAVGLLP